MSHNEWIIVDELWISHDWKFVVDESNFTINTRLMNFENLSQSCLFTKSRQIVYSVILEVNLYNNYNMKLR